MVCQLRHFQNIVMYWQNADVSKSGSPPQTKETHTEISTTLSQTIKWNMSTLNNIFTKHLSGPHETDLHFFYVV